MDTFEELRQAALEAGFKRVAADYWLDRCTEWARFIEQAAERSIIKAEEAKDEQSIKTN